MRTLAWLVAIIAIGLAFYQYNEVRKRDGRIAALETQVQAQAAKLAEVELSGVVELPVLRQQVEALERELAAAEERVDALEPEEGMLASLVNTLARQADGDAPSDAAGGAPPNPFLQMFSGEQGARYADSTARMSVNMQYGPLFAELGLDSETETAVRDALVAYQRELFDAMMEDRFAELSPEEALSEEAAMRAGLDAELAAVLAPNALAAVQTYREELPARMMAQSYDMQLAMLAPDLGTEQRELVTDVLVEEMFAAGYSELQTMQDPGSVVAQQDAALVRALDRLLGTLEETQYAAVERFVAQQREINAAAVDMLQWSQDEAATPKDLTAR